MTADLSQQVDEARTAALADIADASDLADLGALAGSTLGKKSAIGALRQQLGSLDPEDRKAVGQAINTARESIQDALDKRRATFEEQERTATLQAERLDLTEVIHSRRGGHVHLTTQARDHLEDVFVAMGYTVSEGPEVETDWNSFEALNIPAAHPARGMWDTFYINIGEEESTVLRPHTSPVQIRVMQSQKPPIYTVAPGRTYRRDTADASHTPVFHQIEGLVVDKGITFGDLAGTLDAFTKSFFGAEISSRLRPSYFPFTEPSAEYDITCVNCGGDGCRTCSKTGWLELGGCGMVHPNVFRNVGIDPDEWSGFAFGFGIDRMSQMRHAVDDLREFFTNDVRFVQQF